MLVSAVLQSGSVICIHISPPFWAFYFLLVVKSLPANAGLKRCGVWSLGHEDPLEKEWQPTPVFLHGKFHRQRSLAGYSRWGCKDTRLKWLSMHAFPSAWASHLPCLIPLDHHRAPSWAPRIREHLPTCCLFRGRFYITSCFKRPLEERQAKITLKQSGLLKTERQNP